MEDELHRKMNWFVLGNKFFLGDLVVDIDCIDRVAFGQPRFFSDWTVLPAGNDYLYGGAGVEFFPLGNDLLRLHAVYFRDNHDRVNNFDIGITWRFNIYKR